MIFNISELLPENNHSNHSGNQITLQKWNIFEICNLELKNKIMIHNVLIKFGCDSLINFIWLASYKRFKTLSECLPLIVNDNQKKSIYMRSFNSKDFFEILRV